MMYNCVRISTHKVYSLWSLSEWEFGNFARTWPRIYWRALRQWPSHGMGTQSVTTFLPAAHVLRKIGWPSRRRLGDLRPCSLIEEFPKMNCFKISSACAPRNANELSVVGLRLYGVSQAPN